MALHRSVPDRVTGAQEQGAVCFLKVFRVAETTLSREVTCKIGTALSLEVLFS